jgi:hypothetical protein
LLQDVGTLPRTVQNCMPFDIYKQDVPTIAVLMIEIIDEISSWHPCFGRLPACASQISRFRSVYLERRCVRITENYLGILINPTSRENPTKL